MKELKKKKKVYSLQWECLIYCVKYALVTKVVCCLWQSNWEIPLKGKEGEFGSSPVCLSNVTNITITHFSNIKHSTHNRGRGDYTAHFTSGIFPVHITDYETYFNPCVPLKVFVGLIDFGPSGRVTCRQQWIRQGKIPGMKSFWFLFWKMDG